MSLCHCGCGQPAPVSDKTERERGYVKGQPRKFILGHNARRGPDDYEIVDTGHSTPCHLWLRNLNRSGYGMLNRNGAMGLAHRYFYAQSRGSIPAGADLDHLCRQPRCVNPDHLEPVTRQENIWRSWEARYAGQTHSQLRAERLSRRMSQAAFAALLGVTQSTVGAWERGDRKAPDDWQARLEGVR